MPSRDDRNLRECLILTSGRLGYSREELFPQLTPARAEIEGDTANFTKCNLQRISVDSRDL